MKNLTKKLLLSAFAVSLIQPVVAQDDMSKLDELMNEGEELVNLEEPKPEEEPVSKSEPAVEMKAAEKLAPQSAKPIPLMESTSVSENSVEDFLGVDKVQSDSLEMTTKKEKVSETAAADFLGLEENLLPELRGFQRFTPPEMHKVDKKINVAESEVQVDKEPYKGQSYSLIPWSTLNPDDWLSYENWLIERESKDKDPSWIRRLRDVSNVEFMGRVLQCRGTCKLYRGTSYSSIQYQSRVLEGDEIHTGEDSEAWIYLMDGTITRLGAKSSVSFQEINISRDEMLLLVRLNHGHIFWHPRDPLDYPLTIEPETDAMALPLQLREANQEAFERKAFLSQNDRARLTETYTLDENGATLQIRDLNSRRAENFRRFGNNSRVLLVTPTVSLIASRAAFDMIYLMGGDSYFKRRNKLENGTIHAQKRGYRDADLYNIEDDKWWKSAELGRRIEMVETPPGELQVTELVTKRIKTLELAREMWITKYTLPVVEARGNPDVLAKQFGYFLWGNEIHQRYDYLLEYTRRMETTNLRSIENLMLKMEARGDKFPRTLLNDDFYRAAVNRYLLGLKTRNMNHRKQVREMNDLQYYAWILRQGKN